MDNNYKLLPVGSVVCLKENSRNILIIGIMQKKISTGKIYDYMGVLYPEGYIGGKMQFLFMHDDIKKIQHTGFENDEYIELNEKLKRITYEKS